MIEIRPVRGRTSWRLFERLPEMLLRSSPYYLPPFPGSVARLRDRRHPFHRHGRIHPFVAFRNGVPVGRIAGIVNETHNSHHNDTIGFFGFFDFIDDLEVASRLLEAAGAAVGRDRLRGPYSPTQNDECGLLVDGFDASPFMGMPYNPSYYVRIYQALNLHPQRDFYAYYVPRSTQPSKRVYRAVERMRRKTSVVVRRVDPNNVASELQILQDLFNRTLDHEWGFMPITTYDLHFSLRELKAILDPHVMLVASSAHWT